jgi:hypothetical protein
MKRKLNKATKSFQLHLIAATNFSFLRPTMSSITFNSKIYLIVVVVLILSLWSSAWGQASVNENLETAFLYVDGKTGSDSNLGTKTQPLKTIGAAVNVAVGNNHNGIGTRVIINPGTYREFFSVGKGSRTTSSPITFEAATNGTVFVSGADVWTGWAPYSGNSKIYTQSWPYRWGVCPGDPSAPTEQNIMMRREMVVVNGKPLTEVLSLGAMRTGTFFPEEARSTIYVWPPAGTDMATATVEVATRPTLFTDAGQSNVVLRGLTFQYANSCHQNAAVSLISGARNVLLDSDNFLWNNATGLAVNGTVQNFTAQNSIFSHNGQLGFNTSQVKTGLWQSDTSSYNNWRGAQGAFYSWDTGGAKLLLDHDSTFNKVTTVFNQAHGIAFDTDNKNVSLSSLVSVGNMGTGFYAEKSEGPFTFSNAAICGNNLANNAYLGGITLRDSASVSLTGSALFGNAVSQIYLLGQIGGFQVPDWETGAVLTVTNENMSLSQTSLAGPAEYQVFSDGSLGGSDWTQFVSTLKSNNNHWWGAGNTNAFTVPAPKKWTTLNFSNWRSMTGQDASSNWTSVSSPAACAVASQGSDYWLVMMTPTSRPVTTSPAGVATWDLATVPLGGMTGTVNLTLDGTSAIPGASAVFSPASISTSASSVLTLATGLKTPAGTYPVTIIGNSGNVTHTVTVSVTVPRTSVRLSSTSLTFPGQKVGAPSNPQTMTLTNTGSLPLIISKISAGGAFAATNTCGLVVAAGKSCTISVTFTPNSVGIVTQRLSINDVDPTSPQVINLSGTGLAAPDVELSPTFLGFGLHKVGTTTSKTVTLSNQGSAALTITKMSITGTNGSDFSQSNNCGTSLGAAKSCSVDVNFKPHATGTRAGVLSIYDNDSDSKSPQTVTLSGGGN